MAKVPPNLVDKNNPYAGTAAALAGMTVKRNSDYVLEFGTVYVLQMWIDDEMVVKIGITGRRIEERVVEILVSYYHQYRVFPKLYPKRFRKVGNPAEKEQALHKYFANRKHSFDKKFSGSSEYFAGIDETELLKVYEDCLDGVDINDCRYESRLVESGRDNGMDGAVGGAGELARTAEMGVQRKRMGKVQLDKDKAEETNQQVGGEVDGLQN